MNILAKGKGKGKEDKKTADSESGVGGLISVYPTQFSGSQ
jgi:hypothetical protein